MVKGGSAAGCAEEGRASGDNTISSGDKQSVQTLLSALEPISELRDRPIPLAFVLVFLAVTLREGQTVADYAKELNMTRFATFKYIQSLGDRGRHNTAGLGLVTVEKGRERRPLWS